MESTTERQGQQDHHDVELSSTFRDWAHAMSATQIRYLLARGSADGLAEYSLQNNLSADGSHRIWRLLETELMHRLRALTAPAGSDEIEFVRRWVDALTREEASMVLACGTPENYVAHLRAREMPPPANLHRLWALFEVELLTRAESAPHGNVGTA